MSYTLGIYEAPADGPLAGTRVEVTRADGKGFTCCRVTGPRAAEIRGFVVAAAIAESARCPRHVRSVFPDDYGDARSVRVYGRLRQTRDVIAKALEHYSFHLASTFARVVVPLPPNAVAVVSVEVPTIRLTPPAAPGPCGAGKVGWCGTGPGEEP